MDCLKEPHIITSPLTVGEIMRRRKISRFVLDRFEVHI